MNPIRAPPNPRNPILSVLYTEVISKAISVDIPLPIGPTIHNVNHADINIVNSGTNTTDTKSGKMYSNNLYTQNVSIVPSIAENT